MATEKVAKPYELTEDLIDERPGVKTDCGKYVDDTRDRNIENNLNDNLTLLREAIFSNVFDVKTPLGYGDYGDENLQKLHDEAEATFQTYGRISSTLRPNLSFV
ncbi:hypothetical protein ON010_g18860 [Phytophthora cinnamomi]|nr:hypothetical protein ON010_g18860 [Phytophthora cinnamomi]